MMARTTIMSVTGWPDIHAPTPLGGRGVGAGEATLWATAPTERSTMSGIDNIAAFKERADM